MKKNLIIFLIVLFSLGGVLSGVFLLTAKKSQQKKIQSLSTSEKKVEVSLEDRPYITLTPRADGKELTLRVSRIKNATTVEYELTYLADGFLRGLAPRAFDLKGEDNFSRNLLLGSCSANVCSYDKNVTQGNLILRFRGPEGVREFTTDFHLQLRKETLSSLDGRFKIEGKFSPSTYYLIMSTVGLPQKIEREIIAGPYGVFTAGSISVKNGKIILEAERAGEIYAWSGKNWQEIQNSLVNQLSTFVLISAE